MSPEGGALLLSGTNGYLHLLTLKVTPPPLQYMQEQRRFIKMRAVCDVCVCAHVCVQTKEVVRSMKINGDVSGVAFSNDGHKVFVNSGRSNNNERDITR